MPVYNSYTDSELIALIREGDKLAYAKIYERYFRVLYVHALKKLQNEEEAKDLIQELFTVLWSRRESIAADVNMAAYLYTSVRNRVLDSFSHRKIEDKYIVSLQRRIDNESEAADHCLLEKELVTIIENEINALPPKMREIFELSRKNNLSHKEISEKLSISEQTVSKQVTNALKRLRTKLGAHLFLLFLLNL